MQQVVTNLQISQIELRSEDSFDIQRYVHERQVEKFVVPFQGEILEVKTAFLKVHMESEGRRGKEMEGEYWGRERKGKYWRWGEKGSIGGGRGRESIGGGERVGGGREVLTFVFLRFCLVWWVGWLGWVSSTTLTLTASASTRSFRQGTSTG